MKALILFFKIGFLLGAHGAAIAEAGLALYPPQFCSQQCVYHRQR
jgi:hypothetical protein